MRIFDPFQEYEDAVDELELDNEAQYIPQLWRPARNLDMNAPGRQGVPTVDDDLDLDPHAAPQSYPAWLPGQTRVVSGPVGDYARDNPGLIGFHANMQWYRSRWESYREVEKKYGPILEVYHLTNRYCYRVRNPRSN